MWLGDGQNKTPEGRKPSGVLRELDMVVVN